VPKREDLYHRSEPKIMMVTGPEVPVERNGRMNDPYLVEDRDEPGKLWCFYKQNGASISSTLPPDHPERVIFPTVVISYTLALIGTLPISAAGTTGSTQRAGDWVYCLERIQRIDGGSLPAVTISCESHESARCANPEYGHDYFRRLPGTRPVNADSYPLVEYLALRTQCAARAGEACSITGFERQRLDRDFRRAFPFELV